MCGIIGAAAATPLPESAPPSRAREALKSHRHRGPDHQSEYRDGRIWLGHTRLSILDLSPAGNQPMQSPDGRYVISYNGEVFNYRELAGEFGLDDLRSRSDTEVVLRLFARLGAGSFAKLNGQFAFAIYDRAAQKLCLARDRLGIKPLYYRFSRQGLAFASEIKGLVALTDDPLTCDLASLNEWLHYGNALGERTLYEGVRQLLPGHYLELDLRSLSHAVHAYWSIGEQAKAVLPTTERREIIDSTRRLLEQAVRRQLVSDVPVGVFLSGGIDSSAIAAFASRHYGGRLATYSAGFDFAADGSELPKARRVAALYGTDHHEIHVGGEDVGDLVEKMVHHHDAPFGDAANIPLYLMAARISAETKVVLQGDGGDELFGGYRRYATLRYYRLLSPLARLLQRADGMLPDSALGHRIQRYVHALAAGNLTATIALLLTSEDRDRVAGRGILAVCRAGSQGKRRLRAISRAARPLRRSGHRQPDVADGSLDHPARHLPREGGSIDDGGGPGGARAVPRSRPGRLRRATAWRSQDAARPAKVALEGGPAGYRARGRAIRSEAGIQRAIRELAADLAEALVLRPPRPVRPGAARHPGCRTRQETACAHELGKAGSQPAAVAGPEFPDLVEQLERRFSRPWRAVRAIVLECLISRFRLPVDYQRLVASSDGRMRCAAGHEIEVHCVKPGGAGDG